MSEKLPEILFATSDRKRNAELKLLKDKGAICKIGPRLYSSAEEADWSSVVRRNWALITDYLFPGALLCFRSALEFAPSSENIIYLTATTTRTVIYPGLTLQFFKGSTPLPDDPPFLKNLKVSSLPRAMLENLKPLRGRNRKAVIDREEIEQKLGEILERKGEEELKKLQIRAEEISREFNWEREYIILHKMIGRLLTSLSMRNSASGAARNNYPGKVYDGKCLERLTLLFSELKSSDPPGIQELRNSPGHFRNKAFFDSYFSNYIEGTTFELKEAEAIIFDRQIPKHRPRDAHDILGTFKVIGDRNEMSRTPRSSEELFTLLKKRHRMVMGKRDERAPGEFKDRPNKAGDTFFTPPDMVEGTLEKGFDFYGSLEPGIQRAVFIKYLISDVHPFVDGNGRISRIMMNAELVSTGQSTIIIPTVFREDYLLALRALTRRHRPNPCIRMLTAAQIFSSQVDFTEYPTAVEYLTTHNWFAEPDEAKIVT